MRRLTPLPIAALIALLLVFLSLALTRLMVGHLAYPLDDAWIHQGFARSLALHGQWAFQPGHPASGSTAPLWTVLLAPGHWIGQPVLWGYLVGIASWLLLIVQGMRLAGWLFEEQRIAGWVAVALAAEWHLAWAALSGMEIPLYAALALALMNEGVARPARPLRLGLLGGLLTLTRPEGMLLVGMVGAWHLWQQRTRPAAMLRDAALIAVAWAAVVLPLVAFNWWVSGTPFPNTFYAKQLEYASLIAATPLPQRLLSLLMQPWIGGQALLLLALPFLPWRRLGTEGRWIPLAWAVAIVALYALRLPVTYQHARYLMPTVPIFVIYGVGAIATLLSRVPRLAKRVIGASAAAAFAGFALLGAAAYAQDVALIECEMGATARWLHENVPPTTLIALHDIGRIGYVTGQPLLDFAGLVTPDTIPILRDEQALLALADSRGASHLVTFADWYPTMIQDPRLVPVHATACEGTRAAGGLPMTVYEIQR